MIATQDLTIDALQVMTSERFVAVEKNLEAINPGIVPAVGGFHDYITSSSMWGTQQVDCLKCMTSLHCSNLIWSPATVDTLFLATIAAETVAISDDEPIIFDTVLINPGGNYNPALGAYTAPETGYYQSVFVINKKLNLNNRLTERSQFSL